MTPKSCRYCRKVAVLTKFDEDGYPWNADFGPAWVCFDCQAWVGCHPGTTKALGGLANAELRAWKVKAHAAFDPLWQGKMRRDKCSKGKARRAGYKWLAKQLGLTVDECHIGAMNVDKCMRVVQVCSLEYRQKLSTS